MKIYRKVVLDFNGKIIYEDFFEYHGKVALCKKGQLKAAREAEYAAIRSQQEQEKALKLQKKKADELKKGLEAESVKAAMDKERLLALKRRGQQSTIKTIERRPGFETFRAEFMRKHPPKDLKGKGEKEIKTLESQYERLIRQSYGEVSPLKRLILSPAAIKKPRLKKGV